jgi:hypothetical protein
MSGRANARHCRLPQLRRRSALPKTSQPALTRTILGIDGVIGLHGGLKTLQVVVPRLSRNQGVMALTERSPLPRQLLSRRPSVDR